MDENISLKVFDDSLHTVLDSAKLFFVTLLVAVIHLESARLRFYSASSQERFQSITSEFNMPYPKREEFSPDSSQPNNAKQRRQSNKGRKSTPGSSPSSFEVDREIQQLCQQKDHHEEDLKDRRVERNLLIWREVSSTLSTGCMLFAVGIICWCAVQKPKESENLIKLAGAIATSVGVVVGGQRGLRYYAQLQQNSDQKSKQSGVDHQRSTRPGRVESARNQEARPLQRSSESRNPLSEIEIAKPQKLAERKEVRLPTALELPANSQARSREEVIFEDTADYDCGEDSNIFDDGVFSD